MDWERCVLPGSVFQTGLPLRARIQGAENPRLLREGSTDGAAWRQSSMQVLSGVSCRLWYWVVWRGDVRIARRVMRVSLSDWLALQARIRGFKNPRLLRDRPTDEAALAV